MAAIRCKEVFDYHDLSLNVRIEILQDLLNSYKQQKIKEVAREVDERQIKIKGL